MMPKTSRRRSLGLLGDARRLAEDLIAVNSGACNHCTGASGGHQQWCPTLDMPAIVAALEAAERVLASEQSGDHEDGDLFPDGKAIELWVSEAHWEALKAALTGEEPAP